MIFLKNYPKDSSHFWHFVMKAVFRENVLVSYVLRALSLRKRLNLLHIFHTYHALWYNFDVYILKKVLYSFLILCFAVSSDTEIMQNDLSYSAVVATENILYDLGKRNKSQMPRRHFFHLQRIFPVLTGACPRPDYGNNFVGLPSAWVLWLSVLLFFLIY